MDYSNQSPLVAINCCAYNQKDYIRQCLDGFVMQVTNFQFVAIVHDDASTDGTADIIREYESKYPEIIKPIYEVENQYSKNDNSLHTIVNSAIFSTKAKYIAMCEGDDYWIDVHKLQKQVDYMESHPECGIVRTNADVYHQARGDYNKAIFSSNNGMKIKDTFEDYITNGWFIAPCTWLYRTENANYPLLDADKYFNGDIHMLLHILISKQISYLPDVTAVYRELEKSASHGFNDRSCLAFFNRNSNTRLHYSKLLPQRTRIKIWIKNSYNRFAIFKSHPSLYLVMLKQTVCDLNFIFFNE